MRTEKSVGKRPKSKMRVDPRRCLTLDKSSLENPKKKNRLDIQLNKRRCPILIKVTQEEEIEETKVVETEEIIEMAETDKIPTSQRRLVVIKMKVTMLAREEMLVAIEETEEVLNN